MIQLNICFCLLSHVAGYAFHVIDYQLIECHAKLPHPAFRFDRDQFILDILPLQVSSKRVMVQKTVGKLA